LSGTESHGVDACVCYLVGYIGLLHYDIALEKGLRITSESSTSVSAKVTYSLGLRRILRNRSFIESFSQPTRDI
jgi:hypothetical protein